MFNTFYKNIFIIFTVSKNIPHPLNISVGRWSAYHPSKHGVELLNFSGCMMANHQGSEINSDSDCRWQILLWSRLLQHYSKSSIENRKVLSLWQYLGVFKAQPSRHIRTQGDWVCSKGASAWSGTSGWTPNTLFPKNRDRKSVKMDQTSEWMVSRNEFLAPIYIQATKLSCLLDFQINGFDYGEQGWMSQFSHHPSNLKKKHTIYF